MPKDYRIDLTKARVAPAHKTWEDGILAEPGGVAPFLVERTWSGPAGHYREHWTIRKADGTIVVDGGSRTIFVRGMQATTLYVDPVVGAPGLEPGTYQLIFTVEGRFMGSRDIVVRQAAAA